MLPLIARSSEEILLLVPKSFREAADALGVSRWRAMVGVTLPAAAGGILTGTVLAVARAAGETAPLILVSSIFSGNDIVLNPFGEAVPNIPVSIFQLSEQSDPNGYTRAWGEALVLVTLILVANVTARAILARSRAKAAIAMSTFRSSEQRTSGASAPRARVRIRTEPLPEGKRRHGREVPGQSNGAPRGTVFEATEPDGLVRRRRGPWRAST